MTDQIRFDQAVMCGESSPDIRSWPIMSAIDRVQLADREVYVRGNVNVWFDGKLGLVPAFGSQGPISWTLWGGNLVSGKWCFAPWVECINDDYVPTGNLFAPRQVGDNILYYADPPLRGYQPKPGEQIALVVTTGDTRRQNAQPTGFPARRTNVVLVPFQPGDYSFQKPAGPTPTVPEVSVVPAIGSSALSEVLAELKGINAKLDKLAERDFPVYSGPLKINTRLPFIGQVNVDTTVVLTPQK